MTRWTTVLALVLAACGGGGPPAAERPRAAWTGDVSEEAFARLHEQSTEAPPALLGTDVDLGGTRGYLSYPSDGEPRAAVLVIHEWWGLNDHIRHWTDRIASGGYVALAVDLYGGTVATTPDEAMAAMRAVDEAAATESIRRAVAFLESDPRTAAASGARGVIGWCFGGGWSLEGALRVGGFDAVVVYYGRPVTDVERLRTLGAPLLGVFGNQDESIPPARVDEFERALGEAGVEHEILRFDAPHAFANPSGPRYHREAAAAAWEATRAFLHRTLRGAEPSQ
jgi:carboxymethylenebutenolidase